MIHDQLAMSELTWMTAKCAAIATRKRISEMIQVMNFGALVRLAIESRLHAASPRVQRSKFLGVADARRNSRARLIGIETSVQATSRPANGAGFLRSSASPREPFPEQNSNDHNHFETRKRAPWPKRAAIAHPSVSQFSGTRGCRTSAAPASPEATIGANKATARAVSMNIPIPGMILISSGEKRIKRNRSQTAAQIARQDIDAVRNGALTIFIGRCLTFSR